MRNFNYTLTSRSYGEEAFLNRISRIDLLSGSRSLLGVYLLVKQKSTIFCLIVSGSFNLILTLPAGLKTSKMPVSSAVEQDTSERNLFINAFVRNILASTIRSYEQLKFD